MVVRFLLVYKIFKQNLDSPSLILPVSRFRRLEVLGLSIGCRMGSVLIVKNTRSSLFVMSN